MHFHLDGYDPADRVTAIDQALALVDALRARGHAPAFVDIGGGIPMSYIDDPGALGALLDGAPRGPARTRPER